MGDPRKFVMVETMLVDEAHQTLAQAIVDAVADGQDNGMKQWEAINMRAFVSGRPTST
jgi:hypothetical protein